MKNVTDRHTQKSTPLNRNKTILISYCLVLVFGIVSCIPEDFFGFSSFKDIKAFELPGQSGISSIDRVNRTIEIQMGDGIELSSLVPSIVQLSNFATISPAEDAAQDFSNPVVYTVTAEDGSAVDWIVTAVPASPNPQLDNSDFDLWYQVGSYQQPGASAGNTVWDTANRAIAIAADANTNPEDLGGGDFAARMTTVRSPLIVRMAAATMFTGKFTDGFPDPVDPRSNIDFGTPFDARPSGFKIDYKYIPGESYEDANGNPLDGEDSCDMYVLLERREGDKVERIGTAWFRSDAEVSDYTNLELDIKYGELTASDPEFEYANIREGESWGDPNSTPTHIIVVFSSSALGDFFTGAIGSELWVNNFELLY